MTSATSSAGVHRRVGFGGLEINCAQGVLTPREWTAEQAAWAAELSPEVPSGPILELCCGAGQIGLLAASSTGRRLIQVDADPTACFDALVNAHRNGLGDRTEVWRATLDVWSRSGACHDRGPFPLILADPPYLRTSECAAHPEDPRHAIDGGADGLLVARSVLTFAARWLQDGGALLLQVRGRRQAERLGAEPVTGLVARRIREHDRDRAVVAYTHGRARLSTTLLGLLGLAGRSLR